MSESEKTHEELLKENSLFLQQISEMTVSAHEMIKFQSHLESILQNAADGIILFNADGTVKSLNLAAQVIFGYQEIELMHQPIPHLFHIPDKYENDVPLFLKQYLIDHPDTNKEPLIGYHQNGSHIPLRISISEVAATKMVLFDNISDGIDDQPQDEEPNYELFACIIHDLSNELEAKKKIQEKNAQLEKAYVSLSEHDRLRSEFLAKISHELLTPLNGIIGMADILNEEATEDQKEFIQVIHESGLRLENIISNILAFDNDTELVTENSPLDIVNLLHSYKEKFSKVLATKNLGLTIDIEDSADIPIFYTKPSHLRYILDNLIDNALKFTQKGGVHIQANMTSSDNNLFQVIISIQDTGIGVAHEDQEIIFEPFTQLENTITRQFGGVGMGLAIVKQLIENLDAQLDFQSEPEIGTTVTIKFLLMTAKEQTNNHFSVDEEKLEQLKQLLEDDFGLLIETSISELHCHYKNLTSHIVEQDHRGVFASCTMLKNIAEQLGSQSLINKLDELYTFYEKNKPVDASEKKIVAISEEIYEEIELIEKGLEIYKSS